MPTYVDHDGQTAMNAPDRLDGLKRLLAHAREQLGLELGFRLWDGSTVPNDLAPNALAVRIADEGVVAALIRRPTAKTLAQLWTTARIDLVNGSIFDLARIRLRVRSKEALKSLDKRLLWRTLRKFLFVARGGPWPLAPRAAASGGSAATNRQNVVHHYDVSNAFYALWLDREMIYSCGYCTDWSDDIDRMQQNKLEIICRKLRLKPGERLLDIGCGWGALVCYAAQHYGVSAYGVTLSDEQAAYARAKVARLGLGDRVTILLEDYASVDGAFDKIASIGMYEHVGLAHTKRYLAAIQRLLTPRGLYLHHAITRPAKRDERAFRRRRPEAALIANYIFPGSELDHIGRTVASLERGGFEVHDVECWREHYARTCRHWHDRLLANYTAAIAEVGEVTTRMWLAYLAGVSISFERNGIGIYQTLVSKRRRGVSGLPPTRADLYR
jgi:cyclopropane-fatty-acyl-phospholipid synthase